MSSDVHKEASLRELLDRFVDAQRRDIQTYCSGHLNESNLYHLPQLSGSTSWASSIRPQLLQTLQPPFQAVMPDEKSVRGEASIEKMEDAQVKFVTTGTDIILPGTRMLKPIRTVSACRVVSNQTREQNSDKCKKQVRQRNLRCSDAIPNSKGSRPSSVDYHQTLSEESDCSPFDEYAGPHIYDNLESSFVPNHLDAATKKDQFKRLKDFQTNILQWPQMQQRCVLTSSTALEHIEKHLQQDLDKLNSQLPDTGPSFHRLQVYSNAFDELIDSSPTFHCVLQQIKTVYDDYLALQLDQQVGGHDRLRGDINRMTTSHAALAPSLEVEVARVNRLEVQAKELLEENERLRAEVAKEKELANLPEPELPTPLPPQPEHIEVCEQIERLHAAILNKMDAVKELRTRLRTSFVPSSVCTYLSQCVKDTDVEVQKLTSQKEYFEQSISALEDDLSAAVNEADTTDRDAKRIWKRIDALKVDNDESASQEAAGNSSEEDENAKWNWYIS